MSLVHESISPAAPAPALATQWDEAFLRVESYLHAHHVESRVLLNQLATDIIREARERALAHPGAAPVVAAMQVTHARIGAWFAQAGNGADWSDERVRMRGRLALVLVQLPGREADVFLAPGPVRPEFARALASGVLQPGPELRFSNMPSAPLEFGFDAPADLNLSRQGGWPGLRAAAGWLAIVSIYGAAWAASH